MQYAWLTTLSTNVNTNICIDSNKGVYITEDLLV